MSTKYLKVPIFGRVGDTQYPETMKFFDSGNVEIDISEWEFKISVFNENCKEIATFDMDNGLSIVDNVLVWSFGAVLEIPHGNNIFYVKSYSAQFGEQTMIKGDFIVQPLKID